MRLPCRQPACWFTSDVCIYVSLEAVLLESFIRSSEHTLSVSAMKPSLCITAGKYELVTDSATVAKDDVLLESMDVPPGACHPAASTPSTLRAVSDTGSQTVPLSSSNQEHFSLSVCRPEDLSRRKTRVPCVGS